MANYRFMIIVMQLKIKFILFNIFEEKYPLLSRIFGFLIRKIL
ncbi:hypothetical protein LEP1GSC050_3649 [Leptospira broomii serovar Hurstbridge str. 5399]|uniref:Uncharacterized protein n=1 Tax=Leptospira broomii serovar Hurstbridge str. 5399 TaxID=1049789 RepID=T0FAT6_9LEPT|nr:hypothetical protein LEP1GSC050_3649 [Leptospira broomii serovar Hurstbridge str. 5399]